MWKVLLNFIPGVGPFLSEGWTLLSGVGSYIAKHWVMFLFLGMAGTIWYQNAAQTRFVFGLETVPHLRAQIVQLQAQVKQVEDANAKLTNNISSLNSVVGQWKSVSDGLQKKNDALQGILDKERVANNKKVQNILNSKTPTTCEGSIDFLRQQKGQLTW
jgi:peptidoglycan hydrolase CwlO-like protein